MGLQGNAQLNLELRWSGAARTERAKKGKLLQQFGGLSEGVRVLRRAFTPSEDTKIRTQRHSWKLLRKHELELCGMWWE